MHTVRRNIHASRDRTGAAACELAVCLPVIIMMTFASIEASAMIFVQQGLCVAGYEGVRLAIRDEATNAEVTARCQGILDDRGISGTTISIDSADIGTVPVGDPVAITITASTDDNAVGMPMFFWGTTLTATSTMVRE